MNQRYLIRLDDACPRMDLLKWDQFEALLDEFSIKPLIAVIPNNEDTSLMPDSYNTQFWEKVKRWQTKGWEIALHGYNHVYTTKGIGIVPKNNFSEFVGLDLPSQATKIKKGIEIFKKHQIKTRTWIAPGHSFDKNTLTALKANSDIFIVSDGYALAPYLKDDFLWIPAQISNCKKATHAGTWTFCFHPNETSEPEFAKLKQFLQTHKDAFVAVDDLIGIKRKRDFKDYMYFLLKATKNYLRILLGRNG